ncbi:integrase-like protein [Dysgonomonas alginatilytica]|uniref:Integrase-like protein n=1 Tax=Dysgonomonas alginatilytica TaxID=1605892 RepID=A0A2V3PKQ1_9BACT|nr:integrase core domain-containing protein [Dysgonomonas alginatilytica]PXV59268.1 integrase-like protein [Dysgonomonas alginatilytica]
MTENGDLYQNALAERINGILKDEWLDHEQFIRFDQLRQRIYEIIAIYNYKRPHLSCDMKTPNQAYLLSGTIRKQWSKRAHRNYLSKTCDVNLG